MISYGEETRFPQEESTFEELCCKSPGGSGGRSFGLEPISTQGGMLIAGFRGLGFRGLGCRGLGSRVLGLRCRV